VTTEQGDGIHFCCNLPNQCCDSHTARLAAVEALYYAKTGDTDYREAAFRSYNWVTYFQGLPGGAHAPFGENQWWFTDQFTDGPRRLMDAFWAVPEWAPADESHLLGSSSVITKISYRKGSVTYSTFDRESTDVLRLSFAPESVTANGRPMARRNGLDQPGFTFDESTHVLRIRHDAARDIDIQGKSDTAPALYVTFDDPHLAAGTELGGLYASGAIDWPQHEWKIGTPGGKFGTFNLVPADPKAERLEFSFRAPREFVGIDAYNGGSSGATITIRSGQESPVVTMLRSGELRRIRTGWQEASSQVVIELKGGDGLKFDNLAYCHP
jgi:hypothetical protein